MLVGNRCTSVSVSVFGWFSATLPSTPGSPARWMPIPGFVRFTIASPRKSAIVVTTSK